MKLADMAAFPWHGRWSLSFWHWSSLVTSPVFIVARIRSSFSQTQQTMTLKNVDLSLIWLVVWNINFYFSILIGLLIIPTDSYFSEGFNPNHQPANLRFNNTPCSMPCDTKTHHRAPGTGLLHLRMASSRSTGDGWQLDARGGGQDATADVHQAGSFCEKSRMKRGNWLVVWNIFYFPIYWE